MNCVPAHPKLAAQPIASHWNDTTIISVDDYSGFESNMLCDFEQGTQLRCRDS